MLDNPHIRHIKGVHVKVKAIVKVFKQIDDKCKLSGLEEGLAHETSQLDRAMDHAQATFTSFLGAQYSYLKMPEAKKLGPKRDLLKELKQVWRDAKQTNHVPPKLLEQLNAAAACDDA